MKVRGPAGGSLRDVGHRLILVLRWPLLWLGLSVLLLRPTPHRISSTVAGDLGDPMLLTWILSWGAHGLRHDPWSVFDANIYYPETGTLAVSDSMLPLAPVFAVFEWLTDNRVAALNLLMLGLFMLGLASGHALGRRIFGRADAAVVVAVVSSCNSFVFGQQNHPQMQTFGFLALGFFLLLRALEYRRFRDGVWVGAVSAVIPLVNAYFGLIWFCSAAVVVIVMALRGALRPVRGLLRPAVPAAIIVGSVLVPVSLLFRTVGERFPVHRGYEPTNSLLSGDLLTPQVDNWFWGSALDGFNSRGLPGEHSYFPGFSAVGLGALGLFVLWRVYRFKNSPSVGCGSKIRADELIAVSFAALLALLLALGPNPGALAPFRLFHRWVPFFDSVRVTSRFAVIGFVAGALIVGLAVSWLRDRLNARRQGLGRVVAPLVVLLVLVEVAGPMSRVEVPRGEHVLVYEALADSPAGPVLELPIFAPEDGLTWPFVEAPRMFLATTDFNPRVNGYSASAPRGFGALSDLLNGWPGPSAEAALTEFGVRYVVIHGGVEHGYPAIAEAEMAFMVRQAQALGYSVVSHGPDRLVVRY